VTNNQFNVLMEEIRQLRDQSTRIEDRLREVEIIQATDEMSRKVRDDLAQAASISVRWKLSVLVSIAGTVITIALKLIEGMQ